MLYDTVVQRIEEPFCKQLFLLFSFRDKFYMASRTRDCLGGAIWSDYSSLS